MGVVDEWLERADRCLKASDLAGALAAFHKAEACGADPDRCAGGRWLASMLGGHFAAAWRESDAIRLRGRPDPHRFWQGEDLRDKRVIVRCLHGFGDAVQMLRYAPLLRERAASVVFEVPLRLLPLAPFFRGVDRVITWGKDAPAEPPAWDVQVEVMELPYIFRTTLADLPLAECYLELPDVFREKAAKQMGSRNRPRIGIVWAGGEWNPERSVPFALLKLLLEFEEIEVWSLQGGPAALEVDGTAMQQATAVTGDGLLAMAATIANLDLVMTVDTLAAHLAGALGKPAWLMLQHAADWRWMTGRDDSPWYPTLRLFRQTVPGDWAGVVSRVRDALVGSDDELRRSPRMGQL